VLTWLALRYTKHDKLAKLSSYLAIYDEVDRYESEGIATGGLNKGNNFSSKAFPTFTSDPLNRLLTEVRETFSFPYQSKQHSPGEVQQAIDFMRPGPRLTQATLISLAHIFMDLGWSRSRNQTGSSKYSTNISNRTIGHHTIRQSRTISPRVHIQHKSETRTEPSEFQAPTRNGEEFDQFPPFPSPISMLSHYILEFITHF